MSINTNSTFINNMSLPIHRWFRYTAGFSAQWVMDEVKKYMCENKIDNIKVLDPFAGSGTTLLSCDEIGVSSYGFESHPFVSKVAEAKLSWNIDVNSVNELADMVLDLARKKYDKDLQIDNYPDIVYKCYDKENLKKIDCLKKAILSLDVNNNAFKVIWLAFVSILRSSSHAGTASWQYVLPNKVKAHVTDAYEAFDKQIGLMINDMMYMQNFCHTSLSTLIEHDSREPFPINKNSIDLVITSPPYANNYDYADATRLELSVLGEVRSWGDLQNVIRPNLVHSCTQMVSKYRKKTYDILEDPLLHPIRKDIFEVVSRLDEEKENHGGKKNYHTMIALYFLDLAKVWKNLREVCKPGSKVCFVVGDSAPYGVYVPVDEWLGRLAIAAGFKSFYFEKTRDRNIKWKNRKHRVPLKEGNLWVEG